MKLHTNEQEKRAWERRKRAILSIKTRTESNWWSKWNAAKVIGGSVVHIRDHIHENNQRKAAIARRISRRSAV